MVKKDGILLMRAALNPTENPSLRFNWPLYGYIVVERQSTNWLKIYIGETRTLRKNSTFRSDQSN